MASHHRTTYGLPPSNNLWPPTIEQLMASHHRTTYGLPPSNNLWPPTIEQLMASHHRTTFFRSNNLWPPTIEQLQGKQTSRKFFETVLTQSIRQQNNYVSRLADSLSQDLVHGIMVRNEAFLSNGLAHLAVGSMSYGTKICKVLASSDHSFIIGGDP